MNDKITPYQPANGTGSKTHPDLLAQTTRGGAWMLALRLFTQGVSFVRYIIIANLLEVADLGLLGIALLMIQGLNIFTHTGFQAALIQKKGNIREYLNTAWTIGLIRAGLLFIILYAAAPWLTMLKIPEDKITLTIAIIRVTGISMMITALSNIGTLYFQKDLRFNKLFFLQAIATLTDIAVTLSIAYIYRSIWALVIGKLASESIRCLASYRLHSFRPRLHLDMSKASELWSFGKWIFGGTILGFLMTQGDDYFVWGYLGISSLALYQMAYKLSNIPATEITSVISSVTFPAYAKIQEDIPRLREAYLKVFQLTIFLTVPVAGLIVALAPDFVNLFLKKEWVSIIPVIQVLALKGLERATGATRGPLFNAMKRPDISMRIKSLRCILLISLIYPFTMRWNITGTAWVVVIASFATQPIEIYYTMKTIHCSMQDILGRFVLPLIAICVSVVTINLLKTFFVTDMSVIYFLVLAILGFLTYVLVVFLMDFGLKKAKINPTPFFTLLQEIMIDFKNKRNQKA